MSKIYVWNDIDKKIKAQALLMLIERSRCQTYTEFCKKTGLKNPHLTSVLNLQWSISWQKMMNILKKLRISVDTFMHIIDEATLIIEERDYLLHNGNTSFVLSPQDIQELQEDLSPKEMEILWKMMKIVKKKVAKFFPPEKFEQEYWEQEAHKLPDISSQSSSTKCLL